jgi:hypothetical protein
MEVVEELIAGGHRDALTYTPRQAGAWLFIMRRRQKREMRDRLAIAAKAARSSPDDIAKALRELGNERSES